MSGKSQSSSPVIDKINHFAHYLPTQGHIKDFIHHNTLHAFDQRPFSEAVVLAARLFGARSAISQCEYIDRLAKGEVDEDGIRLATKFCSQRKTIKGLESNPGMAKYLASLKNTEPAPYAESARKVRDEYFGFQLDLYVKPTLIRLAAVFFDQGLARWSFNQGSDGLWLDLRHCVANSWVPFHPFSNKGCRGYLRLPVDQAIDTLLSKLVGDVPAAISDQYLFDMLMMLRGWAGFFNLVNHEPEILRKKKHASLSEWLAVALLCEFGFLEKLVGSRKRDFTIASVLNASGGQDKLVTPVDLLHHSRPQTDSDAALFRIHESWEWSCYQNFLSQLVFAPREASSRTSRALFQAVFCIDDREFMLRHFLENLDSRIETFGAPGFFGVDCHLKMQSANFVEKQCPVPVKSNYVLEVKRHQHLKRTKHQIQTRSPVREFLRLIWRAPQTAYRLLAAVFYPQIVENRRLSTNEFDVSVKVFRDGEAKDHHGLFMGYSIDESATRVGNTLRMIGLVKGFAPRIGIVSHGSSSINNPYFSAYDCGACSGRPGGVNAMAFCKMANHPEVRQVLKGQGITLDEDVLFVPLIHDTTADALVLLEPKLVSDLATTQMIGLMEDALAKNVEFRCKQFALAPKGPSVARKQMHVATRAVAWFEPRPEYNHATNFAAVVGRRHMTAAIRSDRAVFLNSYDYQLDRDGKILGGILNAVVPVCGGINLEYFFSRLDPEVYGAGSKLPQNVVGLFGVLTGLDSDLRTGLPRQMTEIHDPLRLLIVVEQERRVVDEVLRQATAIVHWFTNRWVWLVCHDPVTREQYVYLSHLPEKWQRVE